MRGFWTDVFHAVDSSTMLPKDVPNWIEGLPVWACVLILVLIFAAVSLMGMLLFVSQ